MKKIQLFLVMLLVSCLTAAAQGLTVTGKVTYADDGSPVIGATIKVKGTHTATLSDVNGYYKITIPANTAEKVLEVTFTGLTPKEVKVSQSGNYDVSMSADALAIEDVIVTAYGTTTKKSFTGSAAVVKSGQITGTPSASFVQQLQGLVPGVQVTAGAGQPGSKASIIIRGVGSVNASIKPLYVVDGAPYDGDLNAINNDDIESISILKDAASAALYGARGANGVILVTTKRGKSGKPILSAKLNLSMSQRAIKEYDRVGANDYMQGMFDARVNALVNTSGYTRQQALDAARLGIDRFGKPTPNIVGSLGGYNPYNLQKVNELFDENGTFNPNAKLLYQDDWGDALAQNGLIQDYNVNISGGTEHTTYLISLGYLNEEGYVRHSNFERLNARANVMTKVTSWLKTELNVSANTSRENGFLAEGTYTSNPFYYSRMMGPIYPIYQRDDNGAVKYMANGSPLFDMGGGSNIYTWDDHKRPYAPNSNLLVTLPMDIRGNQKNALSARAAAEISFLKDFTFKVSAATDINNINYTTYQNNMYGDAEAVEGRSTKESHLNRSYTINEILTYNKAISDHNITVMLGHENYSRTINKLSATRTGFILPSDELVAGSVAEGSTSSLNNYNLEGYFGSVNYAYANKYYVSGSLRYDGSSRFAPESRWGLFWSAGLSWRIDQENFMKNAKWVNELKLKASYGEQGNDGILDVNGNELYYVYQALYSINDKNNGTAGGALIEQLPNPGLQWEKNANFNVGVDFRFFERFNGSIEFFNRESSNLLFSTPLPESTGIGSIMQNVGTMYNRGFEIALGVDIIRNTNFNWRLDFNLTSYKNRITKLPENAKIDGLIKGSKKLMEGHSIYEFWLRDYAGVDPTDGSALFYKAKKVDGKDTQERDGTTKDANAAGYFFMGDALPKAYGGISTSLSFKGFDLSILMSYQIGGLMNDTNYQSLMHPGSYGSAWSTDILNAWQKPGDVTDVPRIQNAYTFANVGSSRWLTDASYLNLRNVTLGYSLPKKVINKIALQNVRIYVSGENLAMLTARQGMDPQQAFTGVADNTYVPRRTFSVGLNVTF